MQYVIAPAGFDPSLATSARRYLQGALFSVPFDAASAPNFVAAYREKFQADPNLFSALGFDAYRLLDRALGSEFDMPSVYITGPAGIVATSTARVIQPGDVLMIDWGVQLMNFGTDVKRVAYVLKSGETVPPKSIQAARLLIPPSGAKKSFWWKYL